MGRDESVSFFYVYLQINLCEVVMKKKILFIINPKSGTGRYKRVPNAVAAYLDQEKFQSATELASEAVRNGYYMVVVSGGDGTINEVVKALVDSSTILGLLPTGSGNGLAHHMHLPFNLKKAVLLLNDEHEELIDTVSMNDLLFVSIAGVGYDAYVAEKYTNVKRRGLIPYLRLAVNNYFPYKPRVYHIEGENNLKINALLVSFANSSQWGFNVKISPEASVQDGWINMTAIQKPPVYALPRLLLYMLSGNLNRMTKYVKIYKMQDFDLYAEDGGELCTHLDGDYLSRQQRIHLRIHPKSLHIALKRTY